jgi:hypothetical protein
MASRRENLVKARASKRTKAINYKVGAAKRTKVAQSLKKAGVSFKVGTKGMTVNSNVQKKRIQQRKSKRVSKLRHAGSRFRGKRSKGSQLISKVYSPRWETKLAQHAVAYKPFSTKQLVSGESTAIYSMAYNPKKKLLWITFWKYKQRGMGSTYVYYRVNPDVWEGLTEASSKGRYFWYFIRSRYKYSRTKKRK